MSATGATGYGSVGSLFRLDAKFPPETQWNLVVLGDGYQRAELPAFRQHAREFLSVFRRKKPFSEMWEAINVYGVEVTSIDSGADYPFGGQQPPRRRTYLGAEFAKDHNGVPIDRLLLVNTGLALEVAKSRLPEVDLVLVLVNTKYFGGSGGNQVAVASMDRDAYHVAIHEIGHAGFGLADEYDSGEANRPTANPVAPNLTVQTRRDRIEWRRLIRPETPIPSSVTPGCPRQLRVNGTPAFDAVGAFEGGGHAGCGVFRPAQRCCMRNNKDPFCAVCADHIRGVLEPFLRII